MNHTRSHKCIFNVFVCLCVYVCVCVCVKKVRGTVIKWRGWEIFERENSQRNLFIKRTVIIMFLVLETINMKNV